MIALIQKVRECEVGAGFILGRIPLCKWSAFFCLLAIGYFVYDILVDFDLGKAACQLFFAIIDLWVISSHKHKPRNKREDREPDRKWADLVARWRIPVRVPATNQ